MLVTTKKDKGFNRILKEASKAKKDTYVTVGLHKDVSYPDGLKVAQNAIWQHEGTRTVPARPFIRIALNTNKNNLKKKELELLNAIITDNKDINNFLNSLGFEVQTNIQKAISDAPHWAVPLSEASKAQKTGRLLFESGTLYRSVGYQITNNGRTDKIRRG